MSWKCSRARIFGSGKPEKALLAAKYLNPRGGWIKEAEYAPEQASESRKKFVSN